MPAEFGEFVAEAVGLGPVFCAACLPAGFGELADVGGDIGGFLFGRLGKGEAEGAEDAIECGECGCGVLALEFGGGFESGENSTESGGRVEVVVELRPCTLEGVEVD